MAAEHAPNSQEHAMPWHGYLDPADPIDKQLQAYVRNPQNFQLPSPAEESLLLSAGRQKWPKIQRVPAYTLLSAAVARQFKTPYLESSELLAIANDALHDTAFDHRPGEWPSFPDHAVVAITGAVQAVIQDAGVEDMIDPISIDPSGWPAYVIMRYLDDMRAAEMNRDDIVAEYRITALEQQVLSQLPLPHKEIGKKIGKSKRSVNDAIDRCRHKTNTRNERELALKLYREGWRYEVPPPKKNIKAKDVKIAQSLENPYEVIGERFGYTESYIINRVDKMKRRTGARTRVELALMWELFGAEEVPSPESAAFWTASSGIRKARQHTK